MRKAFTLFHRYVGLVMAFFLVIVGLTGSILVWYEELDRMVWPVLREVDAPVPDMQPLDIFELREKVSATIPEAKTERVTFAEAGAAVYPVRFSYVIPAPRSTNLFSPYLYGELYIDPYTGEELGRRNWGAISEGSKNLLPFIYRLHFTLALGTFGSYLLGIIALLWTLDCLVGFYLTLPRGRPFWQKWRPAWGVKRKRLNYDLHRAGGLWPWAMLFVLAWSGVAFNLQEVYSPATKVLFDYRDHGAELPDLPTPQHQPQLDFFAAHQRGQELANAEAERLNFTVTRDNYLQYLPAKGFYRYGFTSSRDMRDGGGSSQIWLDGNTGSLVKIVFPSGQHSGNTVTNWLYSLHMAQVWGLPFRIFVCIIGIAVAMLSITGVVIWWRKRRARVKAYRHAVKPQQVYPDTHHALPSNADVYPLRD